MGKNDSGKVFVPNALEQMLYEKLRLETLKAQRKAAEATVQAMNALTAFLENESSESAHSDSSDNSFDTPMQNCVIRDSDDFLKELEAFGCSVFFRPYDDYAGPDEPANGEYPPLFLLCDNGPKKHECDKGDKGRNELFEIDEEEDEWYEDDFEDNEDDDLPF